MEKFIIKNRYLMYLAIILIIVSGLSSIFSLPILEDPILTNRTALIITQYPGINATKVEALVTEPIEKEIVSVAEVKSIDSKSRTGVSIISIELQDTVSKPDIVFSKLRDKLSNARSKLPKGVLEPIFDDERGRADTIIAALKWTDDSNTNEIILNRLIKELANSIRKIPGTDIVKIYGASQEEVLVELSQSKLDTYNTNIIEIANNLASSDTKESAGEIYSYQNKVLDIDGEFNSIDRIAQVPVLDSSASKQIKIADLTSKISKAITQPRTEIASSDSQRAVFIAIRAQEKQRVSQWSKQIFNEFDKFKTNFSSPIQLEVIFDQNIYIKERIAGLVINLLIGAAAVVAILYLTLGLLPALIVSLTIPLTALMTMYMLNILGIPIHQMSVTGLIVALGLLVDNAIVIVDAVNHAHAKSDDETEYIEKPVQTLWLPLLSSTLTTIIAFSPIALLPGGAGEFVSSISISVICSLVSSYLISIILIPSVYLEIKRWNLKLDSFNLNLSQTIKPLKKIFSKSLDLSLKHPIKSVIFSTFICIFGMISSQTLETQFFPPADRNQFHIEVRLLSQTSIDRTQEYTLKINEYLKKWENIESINWLVGKSIPPFYYNLIANKDFSPHYAQAMVTVKDIKTVKRLIPIIQHELDREFPEIKCLVRNLEQGPPFEAPIELRIYGNNIETLRQVGEKVRLVLSQIPEVIFSEASIQSGDKKLVYKPQEEKVKALGFNLNTISRSIRSRFLGLRAGSIIEENEEIPVKVKIADNERRSLASLKETNLSLNATVNNVPLESIGSFRLEPSIGNISRRNLKRYNLVQAYLEYGVLPATIIENVKKALNEQQNLIPYGYEISFGGEEEERNEATGNLLSKVNILMTLMVAIIIGTFSSVRLASIIFAVAGLSFGLAFLSLFIFSQKLGFVAIIASMGLLGIAINASIIILSLIKESTKALAGDVEAIKEVVMESSTHIISTTLTTFVGFIPLLLSEGDFWDSFAIAIAGGILLSTLISFFFTPQLFLIYAKHKRF
jgi:multidrug efflux pump subunit AcrB